MGLHKLQGLGRRKREYVSFPAHPSIPPGPGRVTGTHPSKGGYPPSVVEGVEGGVTTKTPDPEDFLRPVVAEVPSRGGTSYFRPETKEDWVSLAPV